MHDVMVSLPGATGTLLVIAMVLILKSPILEESVGIGCEKSVRGVFNQPGGVLEWLFARQVRPR